MERLLEGMASPQMKSRISAVDDLQVSPREPSRPEPTTRPSVVVVVYLVFKRPRSPRPPSIPPVPTARPARPHRANSVVSAARDAVRWPHAASPLASIPENPASESSRRPRPRVSVGFDALGRRKTSRSSRSSRIESNESNRVTHVRTRRFSPSEAAPSVARRPNLSRASPRPRTDLHARRDRTLTLTHEP
jgi:hypothetical protein